MQIIDADQTRMIDLPGVGPCPRPVDIDERITGFKTLKSLRIYRFAPSITIAGESEGDEVYVMPIGGAIALQITGAHPVSADVAADHSLYMTPDHAYRLTPLADVQVAYARAAAKGDVACHVVDAAEGNRGEALAFARVTLSAGDALSHPRGKERLIHVIEGTIAVDGQTISAPQTLTMGAGETANIVADGPVSLLMVST